MVERGKHLGFALKPRQPILVLREVRRQRLDGDLPIQAGIPSQIHLTHATPTEFAFNLEWADGWRLH
jgi:hypothetical protein